MTRFGRHDEEVQYAEFSVDGAWVLSMSHSSLRKWSADTGRQRMYSKTKGLRRYWSASLSPDSRFVVYATGPDDTVRVWDVGASKEVACFRGHENLVSSAVFSPDGRRVVSASWDRTVRLWDVGTGREVQCFRGHAHYVDSVSISPDGRFVVSASIDRTVRVWRLDAEGVRSALRDHSAPINTIEWTCDGNGVVTAASDGTVRCWDLRTGRETVRCALSPDDSLIGELEVMGMANLGLRKAKEAAPAPDGRHIVSVHGEIEVHLWDKEGRHLRELVGHRQNADEVAFSPNGDSVLARSGMTAYMWRVRSGRRCLRIRHDAVVSFAGFSGNGSLIVTTTARGITVWEAKSGKTVRKARTLMPAECTAVSHDASRVAVAGVNGVVHVWETESGHFVRCRPRNERGTRSLAFTADGRHIVGATHDGQVRAWDTESGSSVLDTHGAVEARDVAALLGSRFWLPEPGPVETVIHNSDDERPVVWSREVWEANLIARAPARIDRSGRVFAHAAGGHLHLIRFEDVDPQP